MGCGQMKRVHPPAFFSLIQQVSQYTSPHPNVYGYLSQPHSCRTIQRSDPLKRRSHITETHSVLNAQQAQKSPITHQCLRCDDDIHRYAGGRGRCALVLTWFAVHSLGPQHHHAMIGPARAHPSLLLLARCLCAPLEAVRRAARESSRELDLCEHLLDRNQGIIHLPCPNHSAKNTSYFLRLQPTVNQIFPSLPSDWSLH